MVDLESAEYFETEAAEMWSEDENLLIKIKFGKRMELEHVQEMAAITEGIWRGKQMRILSDMRGLKGISKEARHFSTRNNAEFRENVAASAILVGSPISTTIGNLIIRVDNPRFPTRLFTNSGDAEAWLNEFKPKGQRPYSAEEGLQ